MWFSRLWENPAPSNRTSTLSSAQFAVAFPGRGLITSTSSVLSQVARFGANPIPPS